MSRGVRSGCVSLLLSDMVQRQLKASATGKLFSGEWGFRHDLAEGRALGGRTAQVDDTGLVLRLGSSWGGLPEQAYSSKRKGNKEKKRERETKW